MVAGEFTGDGKLDLALVDTTSDEVSLLPGNGDGTFQPVQQTVLGFSPVAIVAGDFIRRDADGKVLFDSRSVPGMLTASAANFIECLPPHSVENVSPGEMHLISVELKV